ncbi:hypothetical protein [Amycolatopsis sp. H20-H5]|uniref:hypothetical protein n=1 Tax=Amycolatopsis sp. H20-H5 TaxID=3046309 RepID=UPI002DB7FB76|nr:hypothetical protein [Amycolatopsis sp. H20-H5]MEC3975721.1 hypothetical protein [Amycolatopsis sp. H20-H5]
MRAPRDRSRGGVDEPRDEWAVDPFGAYEHRWFDEGGRPTQWVRCRFSAPVRQGPDRSVVLRGPRVTLQWNRHRLTVLGSGLHLDTPFSHCVAASLANLSTSDDRTRVRLLLRVVPEETAGGGDWDGELEVKLYFQPVHWEALSTLVAAVTAGRPVATPAPRRVAPRGTRPVEQVPDVGDSGIEHRLREVAFSAFDKTLDSEAPPAPRPRRRPGRPPAAHLPDLDYTRAPDTADWLTFRPLGAGPTP